MLMQQQEFVQNRSYGKIHPLKWGYYANPQMIMFSFTLLLTIGLSAVMVYNVFTGIYHKTIGGLLCIYIIYRFISLGLSSPGLAVQSHDQNFENIHRIQNSNLIKDQQLIINEQVQDNQHPLEQAEKVHRNDFVQSYNSFRDLGFYKFCQQCKIPTKKGTKHCNICKTCIDGHDHHCIWIGKCIGKKNMWQFKDFLCFVFVTLIYALILAIQMSKIQKIT